MFSVFFSNRVEVLFDCLREKLFANSNVFSRRLVIVPSPIMKSWVNWQLANDPDLGVSMGIEFCYVNEAISKIMKKHRTLQGAYFPSKTEIALALDAEVHFLLEERKKMGPDERSFWQPLFHYLGNEEENFTKKNERKLLSLSTHLAKLFQLYGIFAGRMLIGWEKEARTHWQQELWHRIFCSKNFSYPYKEWEKFDYSKNESEELQIHLFAMSFLPKGQFDFFSKIGEFSPLHYYIHSPCQSFWSDLCSDKEAYRLQKHWEKKGISFSSVVGSLPLEDINHRDHLFSEGDRDDFYLMDRNALLANSGKLGRETAKMFEEHQCNAYSKYVISGCLLKFQEYRNLVSEEVLVDDHGREASLLEALQADLALLRPSNANNKMAVSGNDQSIQVHTAVSRMREVEILYNNLIQLIEKEKDSKDPICPNDIIVMAPDISQYEGFIKAVFLRKASGLDIQIYDVDSASGNIIAQGYLHLLSLAQSRWEPEPLLRFFKFPQVRKKFAIENEEIQLLQRIVQEGGIRWGFDLDHRRKCLSYKGLEEAGTWNFGIHRALLGVAAQLGEHLESIHSFESSVGGIPLGNLDIAQAHSIGKWAKILKGLYRDLKPLTENASMPLNEWTCYLSSLLEAYFSIDHEDENAVKAHQNMGSQIAQLAKCKEEVRKNTYSWLVIEHHLKESLQQDAVIYRENHAQAVRFCSMLPMRAIPAKAVCLIGMNEEDFPKKNPRDPMNLMNGSRNIDYCPKNSDYDRYLFLEALLSARRYFIISYVEEQRACVNQTVQPSILVAELLGYLDERYELAGKKISDCRIHRHPFNSFDPIYFKGNSPFKSYFERDYATALAYCNQSQKTVQQPVFPSKLKDPVEIKEDLVIDIKDLVRFSKNPLRHFFNKSLGIYLEQEQEPVENGEFCLSKLDQYLIRSQSRTEDAASVLSCYRKMGKMPSGIFEKISEKKIYDKSSEFQESLSRHQIVCEDFITVDFDLGIPKPVRLHSALWKVPSIEFMLENHRVNIVGRIEQITSDGLWVYGESKTEDLYKHWPQILLTNWLKGISKQQAILLKNSSIISIDISEAEFLLTQFIRFYRICSVNLPLLIPELTDDLLDHDAREFKKRALKYISADQSFSFNPYARWVFKKLNFDSLSDDTLSEWRRWGSEIYGEHVQNILAGVYRQ